MHCIALPVWHEKRKNYFAKPIRYFPAEDIGKKKLNLYINMRRTLIKGCNPEPKHSIKYCYFIYTLC